MPAPVSRQEIVDGLTHALQPQPYVRAAWLGGSDASGRTDQWSDIDLQMVVDDDGVEATFSTVHAALEALSPICHRYRFPTPTWHGHEQELLSLRDAEPFHFVDLVIIRRTSTDWFLEPERHGHAVVLFDKERLLGPAPFDRDAHREKMGARLTVLRQMFPLLQNIVTKAALRDAGPDAMASYMAHSIRPLVELLRMRHCPDKFDFGLRYLDRDLPPELGAEINSLVFPAAVAQVEAGDEWRLSSKTHSRTSMPGSGVSIPPALGRMPSHDHAIVAALQILPGHLRRTSVETSPRPYIAMLDCSRRTRVLPLRG